MRYNVLMISANKVPDFIPRIIRYAVALANSGGGIILADGEHFDLEKMKNGIADVISNNTKPSLTPIIKTLFPETNLEIKIPKSTVPVSTADGLVFFLGRDYYPRQKYKSALSTIATDKTYYDHTYFLFNEEKVIKLREEIQKSNYYKDLDKYDITVFFRTFSALSIHKYGNYPTFYGFLIFGKDYVIRRYTSLTAIYTKYNAKRKKTKTESFDGKTIFDIIEIMSEKIKSGKKKAADFRNFDFVFSNAMLTAFSLCNYKKKKPINIYDRNGKIEIVFPIDPKNRQKSRFESAFSTDFGKILRNMKFPYFSKNSFGKAAEFMKDGGFSPPEIVIGKSVGKITLDFLHKKSPE